MELLQTLKTIAYFFKRTKSSNTKLQEINILECNTKKLASISHDRLKELLDSNENRTIWQSVVDSILNLNLPEMTGGVNPGDQRAIFYLITSLQPSNVLEIGTHIGCSTVHIAFALKSQRRKSFITVDVKDVNDPIIQPWKEYKSSLSPQEMINKIEADNYTKFVVSNSLDFFKNNSQKFDFIFLDGLHDAYMVYQEIPAALKHLNDGGFILLHDYFPNQKPLWSGIPPIVGPYLAVKRLKDEGVDLEVIPLGELPWATKLGTNMTSLALLTKANNGC